MVKIAEASAASEHHQTLENEERLLVRGLGLTEKLTFSATAGEKGGGRARSHGEARA